MRRTASKNRLEISRVPWLALLGGLAVLSTPVQAQSARAAEPVEIVDWIGITGISRDSTQQFEVVRSPTFPYEANVNESYFATAKTPAGDISSYFQVQKGDDFCSFDCSSYGDVSSASGDGSTDGPYAAIGVLIRTTVPVTFSLESDVYLGIGAGDFSNTPYVKAVVDEGFCFTPAASPVPGQPFCSGNPSTQLVSIYHVDASAFETALDQCCAVSPDVGQPDGTLEPGEYTVYVELGTDMNVLFGGGSFSEATGLLHIGLQWTAPCPADLNGDGIADSGDIQAFVGLFLTQDLAVDFNGDGILDQGDIQGFITAFLAGC